MSGITEEMIHIYHNIWIGNNWMTVKEKENYNSSDPSTFSQKIHSTVPNARNKISNPRQCFPRTQNIQSKTIFPTNSVYWHIAVEHNKRTSPARSTTTLWTVQKPGGEEELVWLPYCSPGVVLMISESPENRIQSLFISIFWSKHQIDLWYGVAIYQDQ